MINLKYILFTILISIFSSCLYANSIVKLAQDLHLYPGTKAIVQWKRVFSSKRHLNRYKLTNLSQETRNKLKNYLVKHAIDSKQPIVPGL